MEAVEAGDHHAGLAQGLGAEGETVEEREIEAQPLLEGAESSEVDG